MGGYIGARAGTISATVANVDKVNAQDVTATDTTPEVTIKNTTETDADGGRSGKITFKGEQSGGEESTLAQIVASHDTAVDDEAADLIFKTNDGSDGASPTERLRIDSEGQVGLGISSPAQPLHVFKAGSSGGGLVPLIKVQNDTNNLTGDGSGIEFHGKYLGGEWGFGKIGGTNSGSNFGGALEFWTNAGTGSVSTGFTKKIRIDGDGLKFNADTAAANALDDYEEGTFTPTTSGLTYSYVSTSYTKIGNRVLFSINLNVSASSASTAFSIGGLPFATMGTDGACSLAYSTMAASATDGIAMLIQGTTIWFYNSGQSITTFANVGSAIIRLSGSYNTNA